MSERPNPFIVEWLKEQGFNSMKAHKIAFFLNLSLTIITVFCLLLGGYQIYEVKKDFNENGCQAFCSEKCVFLDLNNYQNNTNFSSMLINNKDIK